MFKLLLAVGVLISAALVAGVYFSFNPVILIFSILGFGLTMTTRIGGPRLPDGSYVPWGSGHGIYIRGRDYVQNDTDDADRDQRGGDGSR